MHRIIGKLKGRIHHIRAEALVLWMTALAFLTIGALILWMTYIEARQYALREAESKATILLHYNLAIHRYFAEQLRPSVSEALGNSQGEGYFDPTWMSSTYVIREISEQFRDFGDVPDYRYKEATIDARDPRNEADPLERQFLELVNRDPTVQSQTSISIIDGMPYFVTMERGETMEESCLICHSTPENAPAGLVQRYGSIKSFHRKAGEVVSAISVRVPMASAYGSVWLLVARLGLMLCLSLTGLFLIVWWVPKRMVFAPIEMIRRQALAIISDDRQLGKQIPLPTGHELKELTSAFNEMSFTLRCNEDRLQRTIESNTMELHRSQYMLNSILGTIPQFVGVINCETGKFEYINRELKRYLGETVDVILTRTIHDYQDLVHEEDLETTQKFIQEALMLKEGEVASAQFRMKRSTGEYCWLEINALGFQRRDDGTPLQVLFTSQDITLQKEAEARLTYMGLHDALTGLSNRAKYTYTLDQLNDESQYPVTLLMADVDNLKAENDTYGHEAGDALLCRMATVLKGSMRSSDLVARLGGDEFAALLVNTDERGARAIQARIERRLIDSFSSDELARFGLSTGMVTIQHPDELQDGLRAADEMMYTRKTNKKASRQAEMMLTGQESPAR